MNKRLQSLLCLVGICAMLSSCATMRLRRQLSAPLKDWFQYHESLMHSKVPKWLDERGGTEKGHFLRLPREMQTLYISLFWEMRRGELEWIYKDRIDKANRLFNDEGRPGWKTDRGHVLLVCGDPMFIRAVTINDLAADQSNRGRVVQTPPSDVDGTVYIYWDYYYRNRAIRLVFKYAQSAYVLDLSGIRNISDVADFMEYSRNLFAPTEEGWKLWGDELYNWVREQEKKEAK